MSITPKKFISVPLNYGDSLQVSLASPLTSAGRWIETADYFLYVYAKGILVIRKSDCKILYNLSSSAYSSGAVITGNTVAFTKGTTANLSIVGGVISDAGITFGTELVISTSSCYGTASFVPIVLENGKIILGYEEYSGTASPYTITPKLANLIFTSPNALSLYETKSLTSAGTFTTLGTGAGLNLYKADANRIIIATGILTASYTDPGKFQLANVATGGIVLGLQVTAGDVLQQTANGTNFSAGISGYCPFPILCDDTNYIILSTVGNSSNTVLPGFVKIKLSDMSVTSVWSLPTVSGNSRYSSTISGNKLYLCDSLGCYFCDKNSVVAGINDSYSRPANDFASLDTITTVTHTPFVITDDFILYFTATGTVAKYFIFSAVEASASSGTTLATGESVTLVTGEAGKVKYVTSFLLGMFSDYSFMESRAEITLNGETLFYIRDNKLLPNSPIVLAASDVLAVKNFVGVVKGQITIFGYETTV